MQEDLVIVSALAELEALVQLKTERAGGLLTPNQWRHTEACFGLLKNQPPFDFRDLPSAVFQTACRSLDRLHLAAMEELKASRLMTHKEGQAKAASEAGFVGKPVGRANAGYYGDKTSILPGWYEPVNCIFPSDTTGPGPGPDRDCHQSTGGLRD
jgi:hypothetical protein